MEEFEAWVLARRGALARTAYLLTGDVHLAEDLVQDTLARVADRWRSVSRQAGLGAAAAALLVGVGSVVRLRRRPPDADRGA